MVLGVSASWLLMGSRMAVSFLLMPLLYRYVPPKLLGVWLSFASLGAIFAVSDLGLASATARALAWARGQREGGSGADAGALLAHGPEDLIRTVARGYLGLGLLVLLLAGGFGLHYLGGLGLAPAELAEARWAWALYALGLAFVLAASTPNYVLQGMGDLGLEAGAQAAALWGGLLLQWLWLRSGGGLLGLGAVFLAQALATRTLLWLLLRRRHAWLFEKPGRYRPELLKALLGQSLGLFISGLCGLFIYQATPLLIVWRLGSESLPDYNALVVLAATGMQLAGAVPSALMPFASAYSAAGNADGLRRLHRLAMKVGLSLQLSYCAVLLAGAPGWLQLWLGPGHFLGDGILLVLCLFYLLEQHHVANAVFTFSSGRWPFAPWSFAAGLLNTAFVWFALPQWGLLGAAAGGLAAQALTNNWYVVVYTLKRLGVGLGDYGREVLLPLLGLAVALGLGAALWRGLVGPLALALGGAVALGALGAGAAWRWVLAAAERELFLDRLGRMLGKRA